jgi:hypothetical protein
MRLYLDDDTASALLDRLLARAGHDVQIPASAGMIGESDAAHLSHCIRENRSMLSRNHDDYEDLHDLDLECGGHHPGILVVRFDNDPSRDLKPPGIVRAIARLLAAGVPIADNCHVLNQWR